MQAHSISFKAMGSRCELKLYGPESAIKALGQEAVALVRALESKYTRYQPQSVTSRINTAAGEPEPVELDEESSLLMNYADTLYEQSEGLFDITSGILRRAWDFKSAQLPSNAQLEALLPLIGWNQVEWQAPFLRLPQRGMEIDLGGFVKEYTADRVANLCVDAGIQHGLVNLGGDIHVMGPHPDGSPWQVGIQHPRLPQQAIASIELSAGAITTSGDYERFMLVDGKRYCHLLNPRNGQSIQPRFASASVIAPQCIVAGSFSTLALLKSEEDPAWLEDAGLPFLTVDQEMRARGSVATNQNAAAIGLHIHTH